LRCGNYKEANLVTSTPLNAACGLTFNHQVQVAVVALHTAAAEEKSTEQALNTYIFQISQQSLKVDRLYKRAERLGGTDEENKYWKECQVQEEALDGMHAKLEDMKLLQAQPSSQRNFVDNFLESVITPTLKRPLLDTTNAPTKKVHLSAASTTSDVSKLSDDVDLGFGFCCAGRKFCAKTKFGMTLALDAGCFGVTGSKDAPKHRCMNCLEIAHSPLCGIGECDEFECGKCADM
jgi:hypothetical protein